MIQADTMRGVFPILITPFDENSQTPGARAGLSYHLGLYQRKSPRIRE